MENQRFVDQLAHASPSAGDHPAMQRMAERPDVFKRQGRIAAVDRRRNGRTFGPYYRKSKHRNWKNKKMLTNYSRPNDKRLGKQNREIGKTERC